MVNRRCGPRPGAAARRAARRSSCSTRTGSSSPRSRRARQSLGVREGEQLSPELLEERAHARRPVRRRRPAGAARLPLRGRRPRRLRGAALGLHRGGLARAADAARAAALAARARRAAGRGRPRRSSSGRAREIDADPRADRRGALPRRARVGDARRLARRRAGAAGAARGRRPSSRSRPHAPVSRCTSRARTTRPPRCGRGCSASSRRTWPRTRSATPGRARTRRSSVRREDGSDGPERRRRRRRRRAVRPAAPLRALLPRRPLARLARHRARPRDREARRRLGRRHRRGPRPARPGPRDPLCVPYELCSLT